MVGGSVTSDEYSEVNKAMKQDENTTLAGSLVESLTIFDPDQITADLLEVALDHVLDEGVIKDIPIIRAIAGLAKATVSIRDRILIKKLLAFFFSLRSVSAEVRQEFRAKIAVDEEFRYRLGEKVLLIIERLDDIGKAGLIARAFRAYMETRIDYGMFQRLACAIDKCFYFDLMSLKSNDDPNALPVENKLELSNAGIIRLWAMANMPTSEFDKYQVTHLGATLLTYVLRD